MATLRIKGQLAAVNRDNHKEHFGNNMLRDPIAPRVNEEYITQVSAEIESRMTKNLSQ